MALLSLRESCHFPDGTQQEPGPDHTLGARGRAAKHTKAQGREEELIKLVLSEVCSRSTMFLESNFRVILNKEKEPHLTGTSVFIDY